MFDINELLFEKLTPDQQKMHIGTWVTTKKLGLPTIGRIMGIVIPDYYFVAVRRSYDTRVIFEDDYPDWREKVMVLVLYNQPQKPISFEDFQRRYIDWNKSYEWLKTHYEDVEECEFGFYPIDDLELYEE